jgi:hypothetical protein
MFSRASDLSKNLEELFFFNFTSSIHKKIPSLELLY